MNNKQRFLVGLIAAGLFLIVSVSSFRYAENKRAIANTELDNVVSAESAVLQDEEVVLQDKDTGEAGVMEEPQEVSEVKAPVQEKPEVVQKAEPVKVQQPKPEAKPAVTKAANQVKQQPAAVKPVVKVASRGTSPAPSKKGDSIVSAAKQYLGRPYVYGASGPDAFDCSGLTMYVFNKFGVSLPHSSKAQSGMGQYVPKDKLQPGDLVFFTTDGSGKISHVGIYAGGGSFVNAPRTGANVRVDTMSSGYYAARYITARRVIN